MSTVLRIRQSAAKRRRIAGRESMGLTPVSLLSRTRSSTDLLIYIVCICKLVERTIRYDVRVLKERPVIPP